MPVREACRELAGRETCPSIVRARRKAVAVFFSVALGWSAWDSHAQIYKCRRPDGALVRTNLPCGPGDTVVEVNGYTPEDFERLKKEQEAKAEKKKPVPPPQRLRSDESDGEDYQ